jgi:N-acetyl sugar amidotransferase
MRYCTRCILPDTRPGIRLDESGVCTACHGHDDKGRRIDWQSRQKALLDIVKKAKLQKKEYDCLVPVSGGKDSWYQVGKAQALGLKVLAVTWRTPLRTVIGQQNLDGLIKNFGVDHWDIAISPDVERRFTKAAFAEKGAAGIPMHMALFAIPMRLAVKAEIPLILWGENPQLEFGGDVSERLATDLTPAWIREHGVTNKTGPHDWIGHEGLTAEEMEIYRLPRADELQKFSPRSIFLGSFFPWDSFANAAYAHQRGFQSGKDHIKTGLWDFADIDCHLIAIHHFVKWYKFGMTRAFDNLSVEIRYGRLSRQEALSRLAETGFRPPHEDIARFCHYLGVSEEWFWEKIEDFRSAALWQKDNRGTWFMADFLLPNMHWQKIA